MNKYALIVASFFVGACASMGPVTQVSNPDFIEAFEQERRLDYDGDGNVMAVENYVKSCCETKEELVALLENNGFDVYEKSRNTDEDFFNEYAYAFHLKKDDDTRISAYRKLYVVGLFPPTYTLYANFSNNKLTRITALVKYPPFL